MIYRGIIFLVLVFFGFAVVAEESSGKNSEASAEDSAYCQDCVDDFEAAKKAALEKGDQAPGASLYKSKSLQGDRSLAQAQEEVASSVNAEDVSSEAEGPGICGYCDKHTVTAERYENTNPSALNSLGELRESESASPKSGGSKGVN